MYFDRFFDKLNLNECTADTLKAYRSDIALFKEFLESRALRADRVKPRTIDEFVSFLRRRKGRNGLRTCASSIRRRLSVVSSYYDFLQMYTNGRVSNPVTRHARPKFPRPKPNPISDSSAERLQNIDNLRDRAILTVFIASGLRLSELHQLNRDSLELLQEEDEAGMQTQLVSGWVLGKGGKPREFYLNRQAQEVLADYINARSDSSTALFISSRGTRLAKRTIQDVLYRWCRFLGIPRAHVHQLRHTALTQLADGGMSIWAVQKIAGHASLNTTLRYVETRRRRVLQEYFAAMENSNQ